MEAFGTLRSTDHFIGTDRGDKTMLEQVYWIAGIVAAIAAVLGLFLWRKKGTNNISQNANVSGQGNTVNQRLDSNGSESNGA